MTLKEKSRNSETVTIKKNWDLRKSNNIKSKNWDLRKSNYTKSKHWDLKRVNTLKVKIRI
jgi:hypothetical protein